jgi:RNA-directed DNA polymerase
LREASRDWYLVNRKRQNNQKALALEPKDRGEAPARGDEETEPFMAKSATENSAFTEQLMEEVCDRENLERAWKRVKRNKGRRGWDDHRRREGVPASALAKHSVSTA